MSQETLQKSAQIVQKYLSEKGYPCKVVELADSTRTAQQAADTLGCSVSQIVKSLIFKVVATGQPLLLLVSGSNRVNEKTIEAIIGSKIEKADAQFTRDATGFAIGGIPPIAHPQPLRTLIDQDLSKYDELWAAAGTPHAVFMLKYADLVALTGGTVVTVV